jgi:hypothetical protein
VQLGGLLLIGARHRGQGQPGSAGHAVVRGPDATGPAVLEPLAQQAGDQVIADGDPAGHHQWSRRAGRPDRQDRGDQVPDRGPGDPQRDRVTGARAPADQGSQPRQVDGGTGVGGVHDLQAHPPRARLRETPAEK